MQLSKSDFLKYQCCPSYLWLWKHKKELVPTDEEEAVKRRFEQGNEVEAYARKLFPKGELIKTKGRKAKLDTEELIRLGKKTIFQATAFTDAGLFAMADVIDFDQESQSWTLYEVKSTNSIKPEHIYDTTFQRVAFEDAGFKIGKVGVIHLNKDYVRRGEIVPRELLVTTDISVKVEKILPTIRQQAYEALEVMEQNVEPKGCSCRLKSRSGHCPTFHYFNPDIPEYSVFNISRIGKKNLALLVDGEIHNVHEVPEDIKLSTIQRNQVNVAKNKTPIVDRAAIGELLGELEYPLYFLDYETVSTALPLYNHTTPFQQIPFQYSLHILEQPNSELNHYEYLCEGYGEIPAPSLLTKLSRQIGDTGNVVVWNKSFEAGRNTEMGKAYPEFAAFMESVNNRMFDLMNVFSQQHYVHHHFKGSHSIKAVLPVLIPEFSYKELDIQNGLIAQIRWYEAILGNMPLEDANKTFASLLKYCCLDTLAMVKIYEYLHNLVEAEQSYLSDISIDLR